MAYADHAFYQERGGTMPLSDFTRLAHRASDYLDAVTFGRAKTYDDAENLLAKACCDLCDAAMLDEHGGEISQETIDGYSVTYAKGITNTLSYQQQQAAIARLYLGDTGLLYRGVGG